MARLRKFVLGVLRVVPFVYGIAAVSLPSVILRLISEPAYEHPYMPESEFRILTFLLRVTLVLLGVSPMALCITSALTLLQHYRRRPSARLWAIACGIAFLVSAIPLIVAAVVIIHYAGLGSGGAVTLVLPAVHLTAGILITSAFWARDSMSGILSTETRPARVKGDGTTSVSYLLLVGFLIAGFWFIDAQVFKWARRQGLEETTSFLIDQLIFFGALFITVALHELGHIGAGLSVGMKLLSVRIGPFHVELKDGHWRLIAPNSWKCIFQGGVRIIPASPQAYRKSDAIWTAAGGPLASLITGGLTLLFLLTAKDSSYEPAWQLMSQVAAISLLFFLANLVPVREAAAYSDGARIYQIMTGHVLEDYRCVLAMTEAMKVGPTRPRDYDIALIEKTASNGALQANMATFLQLIASDYYFDAGRMDKACEALSKAEAAVENVESLWRENCGAFVLRAVCFARNREMAQKWWEKGLSAKQFDPKRESEVEFIAYCIIENRLAEADGAWKRELERTNRLPDNGERAFDLHYSNRLRELLDGAVAETKRDAEIETVIRDA